MAKIYLTAEERATIESVLKDGLGQPTEPQWLVARVALAKSLQLQGVPGEEFARIGSQSGGSELHDAQVTGHGGSGHEDFRDAFAALLSVREGKDFVSDSVSFDEAIGRHVRRGIREIGTSWTPSLDFLDYLLQEMYFDPYVGNDGSRVAEGSRVGERLERILGQLGIESEVVDRTDGPRLTRFVLELPRLEDLDRLRSCVGKIAFALGLGEESVALSLLAAERRVCLDIPRAVSSWKVVTWGELAGSLGSAVAKTMALPICVGTDVLGNPMVFDLAEAPHIFVAGTTGSGKSMCIHAMLLSLIQERESRPELVLLDPKGVEFSTYVGLECLLTDNPIEDMDEAEEVLSRLVAEMEDRQRRLGGMGARNIGEAKEQGMQMRRIVVVVDELADLIGTHPGSEALLVRLAQKARAVGIHLVLATQRPEAATFSGLLRSNVPSRIALTVQKSSESRIIIGEAGAELLMMRGDMLIRFAGRRTVRCHGCLVHPGDIAKEVRGR